MQAEHYQTSPFTAFPCVATCYDRPLLEPALRSRSITRDFDSNPTYNLVSNPARIVLRCQTIGTENLLLDTRSCEATSESRSNKYPQSLDISMAKLPGPGSHTIHILLVLFLLRHCSSLAVRQNAGCGFHIRTNGTVSFPVGELASGQARAGSDMKASLFTWFGDAFVDQQGRGCWWTRTFHHTISLRCSLLEIACASRRLTVNFETAQHLRPYSSAIRARCPTTATRSTATAS